MRLIGVVAVVILALLFGVLAEEVVTNGRLTVVDEQVALWLHSHATPRLTAAMLLISRLHAPLGIINIAAVFALYLVWRKQWRWLPTLALTVPGGMLLNALLKHAFHRARPSFEKPLLTLTSYSFPSGHTMSATVLYSVLAAFALANIRDRRWRALVILIAGAMILLVGFSRMYLGAHYLSDVLAAMIEGLAWVALCLTVVETMRRRRS